MASAEPAVIGVREVKALDRWMCFWELLRMKGGATSSVTTIFSTRLDCLVVEETVAMMPTYATFDMIRKNRLKFTNYGKASPPV